MKRLQWARGKQGGFMLMEIIAALAITSLIGLVVSMASMQVMNQSSNNNNYLSLIHISEPTRPY